MPTPFYHLHLGEALLQHSALPGSVRQFLQAHACAFLFGNTAPDVQVVSGQPRLETHFFDLPIPEGAGLAWLKMLEQHPHLADARQLPGQQAAFLAGYLCHLQADWLWAKNIFAPVFGPRSTWGTFRRRLYLHNVLRAYLDGQILPGLRLGMDACLRQVKPQGWLPFVADRHLVAWRDLLFPQLQPGAASQTVEVFAARGGVPAPDFYALLESEERMQQEIFEYLPRRDVSQYEQKVLAENNHLLAEYLAFALHPTYKSNPSKGYQGGRS